MNPISYQIGNRSFLAYSPLQEEFHFEKDKDYCFELEELTLISVMGEKACEFLQGQVTCDLREVNQEQMRHGALCNLKGRILDMPDVILWRGYQLLLHKDLASETMNSLSKAAMLSRVSLKLCENTRIFGLKLPNHQPFATLDKPCQVMASPDQCCYFLGDDLYICLVDEKKVPTFLENKEVRGSLAWHYLKLKHGLVSIYPETRGLFLPHRLDLHKSSFISFNKGCYKGQEILARTHYRATLKHHLQVYDIHAFHPPVLGKSLLHPETGQEVGELVDFCLVSENHYLIAVSILFESPMAIKIDGNDEIIRLS